MALRGIKVLELAGLAPAPFCGSILADFGATVIKVDKTNTSVLTDVFENGKRSILINLKMKEGVEVLKRLSDQSDVIIEPFRRGVMERLQLGPETLMKTNKRLIYARLTGFGQNGPYANMAGHDINYVGLSGLLSLFGRENEKPTAPVNFAADFAGGGLICAFGIMLALYERTRSNIGQVIDSSMVDGTAYVGSWLFRSQNAATLWGKPRGKNLLDTGYHFYDTYETKDKRYMAVGAIEPQFYEILIEKLGLSVDEFPQFDTERGKEIFTKIFKSKTQKEWCDIFDGTDACVTPVMNVNDAPFHPHNKERGTFNRSNGNLVIPNPSPRLSRTPGSSIGTLPKPLQGEHTIDVLSEFNFEPDEIRDLISKGVVESRKRSKL